MLRLLTIALLLAALALPVTAKPRKRVKPIVYAKPPSVVTLPDIVLFIARKEMEQERRTREFIELPLFIGLLIALP